MYDLMMRLAWQTRKENTNWAMLFQIEIEMIAEEGSRDMVLVKIPFRNVI